MLRSPTPHKPAVLGITINTQYNKYNSIVVLHQITKKKMGNNTSAFMKYDQFPARIVKYKDVDQFGGGWWSSYE